MEPLALFSLVMSKQAFPVRATAGQLGSVGGCGRRGALDAVPWMAPGAALQILRLLSQKLQDMHLAKLPSVSGESPPVSCLHVGVAALLMVLG